MKNRIKSITAVAGALAIAATLAVAHDEDEHEHHVAAAPAGQSQTVTVKGEVLDMVCYIDHNATGKKHAACAKTCIESGLPVGLKGEDGKTYLLVGEHKPLNKELAAYAAQTITVRGKLAGRDGILMLENVEIVK